MISGIYRVHFVGGPLRNVGDGIVVFKGGSINGGDVGYIYRGAYQTTESRLAATVNIKQWNFALPNPVTDLSDYHLEIEEAAPNNWKDFTVTARAAGHPELAIQIKATFLAEVA
jgi:hypothetical protein